MYNKKQVQELQNLITEIEGQQIKFDSDSWPQYQQICVEWGNKVAPLLKLDEKIHHQFNRELDTIRAVIHEPFLPSDFSGAPKEGAFNKMKGIAKQRLLELVNDLTLQNNAGKSTDNKLPNSIEQKEWYQRPVGIIGLTIFAGIIIALAIHLIKKHLGIPL
jgi:hypothetical protein